MHLLCPLTSPHITHLTAPQPPPPSSATQEPIWKPEAFKPEEEAKNDKDFIDAKEPDELEELEDEFADDRFLETYRQRRIEELRQGASRPRFGSLETIRGSEFVGQVTNAGEDVWVVCLLYKDTVPTCAILTACLGVLAERYPNTKFVKILSTDCIPGYPDENLPTILLYFNTKCVKSVVGMQAVGGQGTSPDRVAMALNCYGPVCGGENEAEVQAQVRGVVEGLLRKKVDGVQEEEEEDSDFD